MKRTFFLLAISFVGLVACNHKKKKVETNTSVVEHTIEPVVVNFANDSIEIRKMITEFYTWYTKNEAKVQNYDLYGGIKNVDMPPYKINWDEVTKYQQYIRTAAPQLAEDFFSDQKKMLQECDSAFKVDVEDELAYGFDYDWYSCSQEDPQYLLDQINKKLPWTIRVEGSSAFVAITGELDNDGKKELSTFAALKLKKENDQWKIAKICID